MPTTSPGSTRVAIVDDVRRCLGLTRGTMDVVAERRRRVAEADARASASAAGEAAAAAWATTCRSRSYRGGALVGRVMSSVQDLERLTRAQRDGPMPVKSAEALAERVVSRGIQRARQAATKFGNTALMASLPTSPQDAAGTLVDEELASALAAEVVRRIAKRFRADASFAQWMAEERVSVDGSAVASMNTPRRRIAAVEAVVTCPSADDDAAVLMASVAEATESPSTMPAWAVAALSRTP